MSFP